MKIKAMITIVQTITINTGLVPQIFVLNTSYTISHFILTFILKDRSGYPHFTDEGTEV